MDDLDIEKIVEDLASVIADVDCDVKRFTQAESIEIYDGLTEHCQAMAQTLRSEMEDED